MELNESVAPESSLPEPLPARTSPQEAASGDSHAAADVLERLVESLGKVRPGLPRAPCLSLRTVPASALRVLDDALGQGEVSAIVASGYGGSKWRVRETAFAGIWRLQCEEDQGAITEDVLEAGEIPEVVTRAASSVNGARLDTSLLPPGAINARPLVTELRRYAADFRPGLPAHVVNLSLLPLTATDHASLDTLLGEGTVAIVARSFGNCRMASTRVRGVWRVRYCNSMNTPVVDTIEVVDVPEAARAAPDDFAASRARLVDLLAWLRSA